MTYGISSTPALIVSSEPLESFGFILESAHGEPVLKRVALDLEPADRGADENCDATEPSLEPGPMRFECALELGIVAAGHSADVDEQLVLRLVNAVYRVVERTEVAIEVFSGREGGGRPSNHDDRSAGQSLGAMISVSVDFEHVPMSRSGNAKSLFNAFRRFQHATGNLLVGAHTG